MRILAYDTSTDVLTLAYGTSTRVLAASEARSFTRHAEALAPAIAALLKKADVTWDRVDAIAVGLGPGSFTGLRVGVMTAKALAWALGKPLFGVPGTEAIAYGVADEKGPPRQVAVALDARRGMLYGAVYPRRARRAPRVKPRLVSPAQFAASLRSPTLLVGDGAALHRSFFERHPFVKLPQGAAAVYPCARAVLALAASPGARPADPKRLLPLYLRPRDCNVHGRAAR